MNVFACDSDPEKAARALPDKLVVAMPRETAQMLSTVARKYEYVVSGLYKTTHKHHPCVVWAGRTLSNFEWLFIHGDALAQEYTRRYKREHASRRVLHLCLGALACVPPGPLETFPQSMPEEFRGPDHVEAYRRFLHHKPYALTWKPPATKPEWW